VFDIVRERQPNFSRKIVPIAGDVLQDFLGISDADHKKLSSNVSIVVHSAATLSFVEPLRYAIQKLSDPVANFHERVPRINARVHLI
jgi:alcohol-forming fatty acyl-CoA reductase